MRSKTSTPMQNSKKDIVMGIDPGYSRIGIAIIQKENSKEKLIYSECFETDKSLEHSKRLSLISKRVKQIIKKWKPKRLAMESLLFSKNTKTAIKVAEARGVVLALSAENGIPVFEFNPNTIKLAVTGYGKSDKKQIIYMINIVLGIKRKIKFDDEYDAIAAALTCSVSNLST